MPHSFNSPKDVIAHYHLHYNIAEFIDFAQSPVVKMSDWFKEEIRFALRHRGEDDKEAFTAEFIIVPFLKEVWKKHPLLNLFSHVPLKVEDLMVIPDYLVASPDPSGYKIVYKPLLLTVEAKNEKFEEGWMQALLQAVVCQKLNGTTDIPIFSIVTTGDFWQFGKLEKQLFTKHPVSVSLQHLEELLGILDVLFSECEKVVHG
jgi:hypothetical protein